ncbi:MAG TPA: hypothetical protein VFE45_00870 [Coriobacteriia bacterium]|nr:hypothetical protein [Coriobacteriia bacterium]
MAMLEGFMTWIARLVPLAVLTDRGALIAAAVLLVGVAVLVFLVWVLRSGKRTRRLAWLLRAFRSGP